MKAKFTKNQVHNAMQPRNKEQVEQFNLITFKKGEFKTPVTARCYMGRSSQASVVYACIWAHTGEISVSGKGSAGGYGYHKASAAIDEAISSAGIELYGSPYGRDEEPNRKASISGVGDTAIELALRAIGRALGYTEKQMYIVRS